MMMEIAFFGGLLAILYFAVTAIPVARRVRHLKKEIAIERTRSCWAEARALLMKLVREGKLSPDSATFLTFYRLHSFVLRRPEEYRGIARALANSFLDRSDSRETAWADEMVEWPDEMMEVLQKMAEGTNRLLAIHAGRRFLLRLLARVSPWLMVRLGRRAYQRVARLAKRNSGIQADWTLLAARNQMQSLRAA